MRIKRLKFCNIRCNVDQVMILLLIKREVLFFVFSFFGFYNMDFSGISDSFPLILSDLPPNGGFFYCRRMIAFPAEIIVHIPLFLRPWTQSAQMAKAGDKE